MLCCAVLCCALLACLLCSLACLLACSYCLYTGSYSQINNIRTRNARFAKLLVNKCRNPKSLPNQHPIRANIANRTLRIQCPTPNRTKSNIRRNKCMFFRFGLLPIAYCLLPYCLLPFAYCLCLAGCIRRPGCIRPPGCIRRPGCIRPPNASSQA